MAQPVRVDPYGDLHAVIDRGSLFGNRGILHDDNRTIVRAWAHQNWISCALSFNDRRREIMAVPARTYTGLFFRDEATAFATGARPCFTCRRADAAAFLKAVEHATGERLTAPALDRRLHVERVDASVRSTGSGIASRRNLRPASGDLPSGVIVVADDDQTFVVTSSGLRRWSFGKLGDPPIETTALRILTPPTIVAALTSGYTPSSAPLVAEE